MKVKMMGAVLLAVALTAGAAASGSATTWLPADEVLLEDVSGAPGSPVRLAEVGPDGTAAVVFVDPDSNPRYDIHHPWPDLGWDGTKGFHPTLPAGNTVFGNPMGLAVLPDGTVVMAFGGTDDATGDQHTWAVDVAPNGTMGTPQRLDGALSLMPHYLGNSIRANGAGVLAAVMYDQFTGDSYVAFRTAGGAWRPVRALEPVSHAGFPLLPQQVLMRKDGSLFAFAADPAAQAWTTWTAKPGESGPITPITPVAEPDLAFAAVAANGAMMRGYVDSSGTAPQGQGAWWTYQARPGAAVTKTWGWFNQLADAPRDLSTGILAVHAPPDATQPARLVRDGRFIDSRIEDISFIQEFPTDDGVLDLAAFQDGAIREDLTGDLPRIVLAQSASSMFGAANRAGVSLLTYQHQSNQRVVAAGGGIGTQRRLRKTPSFWQVHKKVSVSWKLGNAWARPGRDKILRDTYLATKKSPYRSSLFRGPGSSTKATLPVGKPGYTRCYRITGKDSADTVTETPMCVASPEDDWVLHKGSGWRKVKSAGYWQGSAVRAKAKGSHLTYRTTQATSLALVVRTCPGCGTVKVVWGSLSKTVDLRSSKDRRRVVIPLAARAKGLSQRVKITVTSSGKPVYVDGLGVSTVPR